MSFDGSLKNTSGLACLVLLTATLHNMNIACVAISGSVFYQLNFIYCVGWSVGDVEIVVMGFIYIPGPSP